GPDPITRSSKSRPDTKTILPPEQPGIEMFTGLSRSTAPCIQTSTEPRLHEPLAGGVDAERRLHAGGRAHGDAAARLLRPALHLYATLVSGPRASAIATGREPLHRVRGTRGRGRA